MIDFQAKGIIHLGATSAFVQDNADLLLTRDCLDQLIPKLVDILRKSDTFFAVLVICEGQ